MKLLPLLLLLACVNRYDDMDLMHPPFQCVTNTTAQTVTVLAEGRFASEKLGRPPGATVYRMLGMRRVGPGAESCFRWPWVSREGRIVIVTGTDTTWGEWFDPWQD